MSRTDKTKPWRVRVAEHNPKAVHRHANGVCDLPEDPRDIGSWPGCHWSDWGLTYPDQCCWGCGCRLCSGYYWRKAERRRKRHQRQREHRSLEKRFHTGNPSEPVA